MFESLRSSNASHRWLVGLGTVAVLALVWFALWVSEPPVHEYVARSASESAELECSYEQAQNAADQAHITRDQMRRYGASPSVIAQAEVDVVATQRAADNAKQCEETARSRADLDAQWRSAYATESGVYIASRLRYLALIEIALLVATVGAAFAAVADGRSHAEREMRAYLKVELEILKIDATNGPVEANYLVTNTGSTPAYNVHVVGAAEYLPYPAGGDFSRGSIPNADLVLHGQSKPQGFTEEDIPKLDPAQASDVAAGTIRLFCYGTIYYDDVFRKKRFTNYCFVAWGGSGGVWHHNYHNRHNESDDPSAGKTTAPNIFKP